LRGREKEEGESRHPHPLGRVDAPSHPLPVGQREKRTSCAKNSLPLKGGRK
jgi:hypothetical protein